MDQWPTIFRLPKPRHMIRFTVLFLATALAIYRIGFQVPPPILNPAL